MSEDPNPYSDNMSERQAYYEQQRHFHDELNASQNDDSSSGGGSSAGCALVLAIGFLVPASGLIAFLV
jgi:hypothetical protein